MRKRLFLISLITILIVSLIPVRKSRSEDLYDSGNQRASVSTTQTLRLIILPAYEVDVLGQSQPVIENGYIEQTVLLGLRANTPWNLQVSTRQLGQFSEPLQWSASQESGPSNSDENMQLVYVSYCQPLSWADDPGTYQLELEHSLLGGF